MLFLVSNDPCSALQLQQQLKLTGPSPVEIYLSVEEAESKLYQLPHLVIIDDRLHFSDLLYLTQSIKAYDNQIEVLWLCSKEHTELEKIHRGYGVAGCLPKDSSLPEQLALMVDERLSSIDAKATSQKRIQLLKRNLLDTGTASG